MWELCCRGGQSIDYDLDTHGANYWVCDGIIHQQLQQGQRDDDLWRAADALQLEMPLDVDYHQFLLSPYLATFVKSKPYWSSPACGFTRIPDRAISNGAMFQHYADKLGVLKLSGCTFDFQSPPFLCCHSLRFLWLDHCRQGTRTSTDGAGDEEDIRRCFQRLWVLDVRHMDCVQILSAQMLDLMTHLKELNVMGAQDWDIGQLQGRLPNIRKLRVNRSVVTCISCSESDLFLEMDKMELLDFSGNGNPMKSLFGPGVSGKVTCLETLVIVEGYYVEQISFNGCNKLKNLLLQGRMRVRTLDLSGTAVKTLDLSTTRIRHLDELYLLDCNKLCAILWPSKDRMKDEGLGKLCIDTTRSAPATQSREEKAKMGTTTTTRTSVADAAAPHGSRLSSEFDWHISVRDARLLLSLEPVYSDSRKAYVEVSSPLYPTVASNGSKDKGIKSRSNGEQQVLVYADMEVDHLQPGSRGNCGAPCMMWIWPCPDVPDLPEKRCYMHIQADRTGTKLLSVGEETSTTITVPKFVIDCAKILHVHDSMSMNIFPSSTKYLGSEWHMLEWCRIERCAKLDCVFTPGEKTGGGFVYRLTTFWASQLLKARYIWKTSEPSGFCRTFPDLRFLHLSCCPRLIHVLPLSYETFKPGSFSKEFGHSLSQLVTLEITWCGDLQEVFPLDIRAKIYVKQSQAVTLYLPSLKHIHLHELPRLERICGVKMSALNLETVKIRGCWSLTRLPDVSGSNKAVECDCEKEWWDRLVWDDRSQKTHYRPIHSRYYKKNMLRSTVLR